MKLCSRSMTQRITLQQPSTSLDDVGQAVPSWSDVATVWASAQPLRGREYWAANSIESEAVVRFRMRWRSGVTSAMRVIWRGAAHAIVSPPIDVNGESHTLELMCSEGSKATA